MIAEVGDTVISRQLGTRVYVNEANVEWARFLIREGKYWDLEKGTDIRKRALQQYVAETTAAERKVVSEWFNGVLRTTASMTRESEGEDVP